MTDRNNQTYQFTMEVYDLSVFGNEAPIIVLADSLDALIREGDIFIFLFYLS